MLMRILYRMAYLAILANWVLHVAKKLQAANPHLDYGLFMCNSCVARFGSERDAAKALAEIFPMLREALRGCGLIANAPLPYVYHFVGSTPLATMSVGGTLAGYRIPVGIRARLSRRISNAIDRNGGWRSVLPRETHT